MSRPLTTPPLITEPDYLAGENEGLVRHEFIAGHIYARAGASERHNIIKLNLASRLNLQVADECRVFDGDTKLKIVQAEETRFYYPDVFVSCEPGDPDQHVRGDAILVVEVLSPSTERSDRYEKFAAHISLPTLSEHVLVEQAYPRLEVVRRRTGRVPEIFGGDASVTVESIGQTLAVADIYRKIAY